MPKYVIEAVDMMPHIHGMLQSGIAPVNGIPEYSQFRRWSRDRLAPLPGVEVPSLREKWVIPYPVTERLEGAYWFAGHLDDRFGHFLTETITRSWWHIDNPEHGRTAVFISVGNRNPDEQGRIQSKPLNNWQKSILSYLGIDDFLIIEAPTHFTNLLIPEPGALLFSSVHEPEYLDSLYRYNLRVQGERALSKKLFLARSSDIEGGVIGENLIAEAFADAGYEVVIPERMPINDQLKVVRAASHVVASQGSALHLFNLIGKSPETKVLLFQRLGDFSSNAFDMTLRPYVGELDIVPESIRVRSTRGTNFDYTVPNVEKLCKEVSKFDNSVNVTRLNKQFFFDELVHFSTRTGRQISYRPI